MSDFLAKTFIIAFIVVYGLLLVSWLIWGLRHWFTARPSKGVEAKESRHQISHLDLSHHNRDAQ